MQKDEKNHQIHPVAAALTGVVVGASAVTVGVVALKDEKNRLKVKKVLENVKDQAAEYMDSMQEKIKTTRKTMQQKTPVSMSRTIKPKAKAHKKSHEE